MSTQIDLSDLANTVAGYRFAYLLTAGSDGRPHALAVTPRIQGSALAIDKVGRRSRDNLLARPDVTLLWPPESVNEHSLIVDGRAAAEMDSVRITPTRAVLHRPAPRPEPSAAGGCDSDCIELPLPTGPDCD